MIVFEFDWDISMRGEFAWYLSGTSCTQEDKQHADEIYQQMDANTVGWGMGV